jgi:hypothetical protein
VLSIIIVIVAKEEKAIHEVRAHALYKQFGISVGT